MTASASLLSNHTPLSEMTSPSFPNNDSEITLTYLRNKFNTIPSRLIAITDDIECNQFVQLNADNVMTKSSVVILNNNSNKNNESIKPPLATTLNKQKIQKLTTDSNNDSNNNKINSIKKDISGKKISPNKVQKSTTGSGTPQNKLTVSQNKLTVSTKIQSANTVNSDPFKSTIFSTPNSSKKPMPTSVSKSTPNNKISKNSSSTINNVVESVIKSINRARVSMGESSSESAAGVPVHKTTADDRKMLIAASQRARENLAVKRILTSTILPAKLPISPDKDNRKSTSSSSSSSSLTTPVKPNGMISKTSTNSSLSKIKTGIKPNAISSMPPPSTSTRPSTSSQMSTPSSKSSSHQIGTPNRQKIVSSSDDGRVGRSLSRSTSTSTPLRSSSTSSAKSTSYSGNVTPSSKIPPAKILGTPIHKPRTKTSVSSTPRSSYKSSDFHLTTSSNGSTHITTENTLSSTGEIFNSMKTEIEEYISPKKVADNPFAQLMFKK